jgi:hypothetical protein
MNKSNKNTSILSISSDKLNNCNKVVEFFKKNKIMCSVSENISVISYKNEFKIEKGCNIIFNSHKPTMINHNFWNSIKKEFNLTCAHLKVEGKYKGCINDYLRDSICSQ